MTKEYNFDEFMNQKLKNPEFRQQFEETDREMTAAFALLMARHQMGLTQRQLAKKTGTAQSTIARIEQGNFDLRLSTLKKIANGVGKKIEIKII